MVKFTKMLRISSKKLACSIIDLFCSIPCLLLYRCSAGYLGYLLPQLFWPAVSLDLLPQDQFSSWRFSSSLFTFQVTFLLIFDSEELVHLAVQGLGEGVGGHKLIVFEHVVGDYGVMDRPAVVCHP